MQAMTCTLATFGAFDWGVLAVYMAAMLIIGAVASRQQHDSESYFLGGHSMPAWAVALSVLATAQSAATFIGAPQLAYAGDLTYLILNLGGIVAAVIVAALFLPAFYKAGTLTIYGYLGQRFGAPAATGASVSFLLGRLLASGARLYIAGIAFSLVVYGDLKFAHLAPAIVVFGLVGTLYTVAGGIRAVIWTDVAQFFVVIGAAMLTVALLLHTIPLSPGEIVHALQTAPSGDKLTWLDTSFRLDKPYTLWAALASTFLFVAAYGADQDLVQRMLTCKSAWRGSVSLIWAIVVGLPVAALFMAIGLLLWIFYHRPDLMGAAAPLHAVVDSRQVYPQYLLHQLPKGVAGLAMAGLCAAAMSSLDSAVNAMASTVMADLYLPWRRKRGRQDDDAYVLRTSRWAVAGTGVVLTGAAVGAAGVQQAGGQMLIDFAMGVMSFAYAGLLGVFLAALLTRRGNWQSALASMVVGAIAVLLVQPYVLGPMSVEAQQLWAAMGWGGAAADAIEPFKLAWPWWMVVGTAASFVVCIVGTNRDQGTEGARGQERECLMADV